MRRIGIVFVGGGLGSLLRAGLLTWLAPGGATSAVLMVNLLGAFALGVVFVLADEAGVLQANTRFFMAVGVLGGFTTFSTFIWGADLLLTRPAHDAGLNYVIASVGGGAVAMVAGLAAGRELVLALERGAVALLNRLDARGLRRVGQVHGAINAIEAEDCADSHMLTEGDHEESA